MYPDHITTSLYDLGRELRGKKETRILGLLLMQMSTTITLQSTLEDDTFHKLQDECSTAKQELSLHYNRVTKANNEIETLRFEIENKDILISSLRQRLNVGQENLSLSPEEKRLSPEEKRLYHEGKKIHAIKLYRERTGATLLEAKNSVERYGNFNPVPF
jgi:hypothetical protein